MEDLRQLIRREINLYLANVSTTQIGIVDSYDEVNHAAKVRYQPEDTLSGWLPVGTAGSGNGFGVHFAPNIGNQVLVHFLNGDREAGVIGMRLYSDQDRPLPVPAGELWVVDPTGAAGLKFRADNSGEVIAPSVLNLTSPSTETSGNAVVGTGASGSFTTPLGQTVTVRDGIITNIY